MPRTKKQSTEAAIREPRMERVYPTPWTRCNREEDYRVAWAEFERRLGKTASTDGGRNADEGQ